MFALSMAFLVGCYEILLCPKGPWGLAFMFTLLEACRSDFRVTLCKGCYKLQGSSGSDSILGFRV